MSTPRADRARRGKPSKKRRSHVGAENEPFFLGSLAVWVHRAQSESPKARVLLVHGLSEHSGRHLNTVDWLTRNDCDVVRFDLRGAGHSGGRRQWIESFEDYVEDVVEVYNWICRAEPDLPLFVLGHSLGGAIAVHFAALYGAALNGLILSAPAYLVGSAISPLKIAAGMVLAKLAPSLILPKSTSGGLISRDPGVCDAFDADPLSCHFNTLQQGALILKSIETMPTLCRNILAPVLLVHGSADKIIRLEGSYGLLRCLGSADKMLYVIPGGYHEPHNDLDREDYFVTLARWIAKRAST